MIKYKIHPSGSIKFLSECRNLLILVDIYDKNNILLSKCLLNAITSERCIYRNVVYHLIIKNSMTNKHLTNHIYYCKENGYYHSYEDDNFYLVVEENNTISAVLIEPSKIKILDFWDPDDPEKKRHKEYFRNYIWEEMMRVFWDPKRKWYVELEKMD